MRMSTQISLPGRDIHAGKVDLDLLADARAGPFHWRGSVLSLPKNKSVSTVCTLGAAANSTLF